MMASNGFGAADQPAGWRTVMSYPSVPHYRARHFRHHPV